MGEKVNKARLQAILGKDHKTILKLQNEGMPVEKEGKRGTSHTFDTEKVVDWLIARAKETDKEMERARIRLITAQAIKTELEADELQGNLISLDKMKMLMANVLGTVRARILSMPSRITPLISTMKDPKKIQKTIKEACDEALQELADYDPEADTQRKNRNKGNAKDSRSATSA